MEKMAKNQKQVLWTKDFILLALCNTLVASGAFCLIPTLPVFAEQSFEVSKSEIGYILGLYTLTALLVRPFAGIALDILNRKMIYLFSLLAFIVLMLFYNWVSSLFLLLSLRLLHGLAWGIVTTGGNTIAADMVPPARRGEGIGYFGMSFTISMALGPVMGLKIIEWSNDFNFFFTSIFFFLLSAFLLALLIRYPMTIQAHAQKPKKFQWSSLFEPKALPISLIALLCSIVYAGLISFITLYAKELDIPNSELFFVAYALGLTLVRPFAGRIMDQRGPYLILMTGFVLISTGLWMLFYITDLNGFLITAFVTGLGMGTIFPTSITMVVNLVSAEKRGVANSTYFSAIDVGVGLGAIFLGFLSDMIGIRYMFLSCILIIVLAALYFLLFAFRNYESKLAEFKAVED